MNRKISSKLILVAAIGLLFMVANCAKPEDKLADHADNINEIMEDNMDSPKDGVDDLRDYLRSNLPEMLELVGKLNAEFMEIDDDDERKERTEALAKLLEEKQKTLTETGMKFFGKVMEDEEAAKHVGEIAESYAKMEKVMKKF